MFSLFRSNPATKLKKKYERKLEEALEAQRSGKIPLYATLTAEAEELGRRLEELERDR